MDHVDQVSKEIFMNFCLHRMLDESVTMVTCLPNLTTEEQKDPCIVACIIK